MTIQPLKNDQDVMPVVNNTKTFNAVNEVVHLSTSSIQVDAKNVKTTDNNLKNVVLSGAVTSPGKEIAINLASIRNNVQLRTDHATAAAAAVAVEHHLAEIQHVLHFAKNYPSFSADDTKREAFLMTISGIRDQIIKMTMPPPPPAIPPSGMWKDLFKGIDVPTLPATNPVSVGDGYLQTAHTEVTYAQMTLAERRMMLVQLAVPLTTLSSDTAVKSSVTIGQQLSSYAGSLSNNLVGELQNL